jgi:ribosome biogenesis GTPase / thiamine phosphate phosphatase
MIDSIEFERLRSIGLTPRTVQQLMLLSARCAEPRLMRVTELQREGLTLHDGEGEHAARMLPAVRNELQAQDDALAVGDWVLTQRNALGEWWVHQRLPPLTQIARRGHDGREKTTRMVIVSNVDIALLVMGLDHDFNLRRLQRYLALVALADVQAVVVLTKADLCADAGARQREVQAVLPASAAVVTVNALGSEPRERLSPWLVMGQTLVLLGSSGAGKSTLTNALTDSLAQDTGANRAGDSRGRHTTTTRSLHRIPGGACIIDTPGIRTLRLDSEAGALEGVFTDIAQHALQCRFRDCRHGQEPGCAVREAVPAERLLSFQKLQREASRDTLSALERKAQVSQWKARGRAAKARMEAKRG